MLRYILKILMREYATYILLVILMVNSLYAVYFANTNQMVIESTTYYYLSSYRPHVVLFLTASLYSLDENVSASLNKLVSVNESVHNLIKYYKELDASTLFCIYRFNINGTSFRLFIGETDSLKRFGFNIGDIPSNDRNYLYVLRGDINTTANIIEKLINDENIEFYPLSYTAYNYPLDIGSSSIDLFIPINNLTSALHNHYLEEIIRNTWNNSQVIYRSVVGYTYISLNFIDIDLVRGCMDSPQLVLQKIIPIMTEFVNKLGKAINYRIHYGFMITNQHSAGGEIKTSLVDIVEN